MGKNVWIGYDAIIETSYPHKVTIKDGATIGIRTLIIAHFRGLERGVVIEEDAFVGPGVIILPNVVIGRGSVVAAGSVVTSSAGVTFRIVGPGAKLESWQACIPNPLHIYGKYRGRRDNVATSIDIVISVSADIEGRGGVGRVGDVEADQIP